MKQAVRGNLLKTIIRSERGQDLIEYGLLGSFISISTIATLRIIGAPIDAMFQRVLAELR
jgi:Flp pilus assembly pilin Flp